MIANIAQILHRLGAEQKVERIWLPWSQIVIGKKKKGREYFILILL